MHPAPSVIVFTVLSGIGFGLMFWLGLGAMNVSGFMAASVSILALGLACIGLLASTFHLGHPERALLAFTQWRSSWLSREGVVSVATLVAFSLYAAAWVFWDVRVWALGWIASILAALTVFCTAMIYAQLKTVPRWNTALTPLLFVLYALALPAMLVGQPILSFGYFVALTVVQMMHWNGRKLSSAGSPESATGLESMGEVRLLEAPHSGPNYLVNEMIFKVGRARAEALRKVVLALGFGVPIVILALWGLGWFAHWLLIVAGLAHLAGAAASRWLFFAEAEHVVGLYYGQR